MASCREAFALTKKGLLLHVGGKAQVGDELCVLRAAPVSVVVRPFEGVKAGDEVRFVEYVGTAFWFCHCLMDGPVVEDRERHPGKSYHIL